MFISEFIEYLSLEKKSSSHTIIAYKKDIQSFVEFYLQQYDLTDISASSYSQIRSWIVHLVDSGVSNRTVNRKVASLKAYFKFLLKTGNIDKNPLAKHQALKVAKKLQLPFSFKEVEEVLELLSHDQSFKGIRNKLLVELFYATGIRRAELVNLQVKDLDLVQRQIKVVGKRNKERYIPLLPSVSKSAAAYLDVRNRVEKDGNCTYLFITEKGVKIYETLVYRIINSYFSKASTKVKKSPHILRHTFATQLLGEGASLNAVKELLGHSSLAATQVYTHQSITQLAQIYKKAHPRNKNS